LRGGRRPTWQSPAFYQTIDYPIAILRHHSPLPMMSFPRMRESRGGWAGLKFALRHRIPSKFKVRMIEISLLIHCEEAAGRRGNLRHFTRLSIIQLPYLDTIRPAPNVISALKVMLMCPPWGLSNSLRYDWQTNVAGCEGLLPALSTFDSPLSINTPTQRSA
jgi:hypothetical protein